MSYPFTGIIAIAVCLFGIMLMIIRLWWLDQEEDR